MSDDWEWNPTFRTPDGDKISTEVDYSFTAPYRRENVLRAHLEDGKAVVEIAEVFDVGENTIRFYMRQNGIDLPDYGRDPEERFQRTRQLHEHADDTWGTNQYANDGEGRVERMADGGHDVGAAIEWMCKMYECPDCGDRYPTPKGQHDCMRGHARKLASQLANANEAIL